MGVRVPPGHRADPATPRCRASARRGRRDAARGRGLRLQRRVGAGQGWPGPRGAVRAARPRSRSIGMCGRELATGRRPRRSCGSVQGSDHRLGSCADRSPARPPSRQRRSASAPAPPFAHPWRRRRRGSRPHAPHRLALRGDASPLRRLRGPRPGSASPTLTSGSAPTTRLAQGIWAATWRCSAPRRWVGLAAAQIEACAHSHLDRAPCVVDSGVMPHAQVPTPTTLGSLLTGQCAHNMRRWPVPDGSPAPAGWSCSPGRMPGPGRSALDIEEQGKGIQADGLAIAVTEFLTDRQAPLKGAIASSWRPLAVLPASTHRR